MSRFRPFRRPLVALAAVAAIAISLCVGSTSTAALSAAPSLRLFSVLHRFSVARFTGERQIQVAPGIYLASTGGAFEIDAVRTRHGIALWQVRRDSTGVHRIRPIIPASTLRMGAGLPDFLHAVVRNPAGRIVTSQFLPYCFAAAFDQERVDASGPDRPSYPYDCGGRLTHATVWGIDQGWANSLYLGLRFAQPDGAYQFSLAITAGYARQLGIPAAAAHVTLTMTVRTTKDGACKDVCVAPPQPAITGESARSSSAVSQAIAPAAAGDPGTATPLDQPGTDGIPDMRALPAHDLSVTHNRRNGHDYLNFGATIWNAGSGPFVLEGFRSGAREVMTARQFIYQDGKPVSSKVTGQFEFDKRRGHHHWHMEDIAQYDLLDQDGNRVVLSDKQSFCLAPTDPIDLTRPGADWQADQAGLWSACQGETAIWLREVLPAGWGDTYYQSVAGQSFDITSLKNGHYQIRVTADPLHRLVETSYENNVGLLPITVGGSTGHRTVTVG